MGEGQSYKCCGCCPLNLLTAAKIVSIGSLVIGLGNFMLNLYTLNSSTGLLLVFLVCVIPNALAIVGAFSQLRLLFVPFILVSMTELIFWLALVLASVIAIVDPAFLSSLLRRFVSEDDEKDYHRVCFVTLCIVCVLCLALQAWFLHVIVRCYHYLSPNLFIYHSFDDEDESIAVVP